MSSSIEIKIAGLIAAPIEAAGYELVRAQLSGGGKYAALQVMAERKDGAGMSVEDCAKLSRIISELIEGEADLADRYDLEVSSPGIDRPLVKPQDFERFLGHVAKIELNAPLQGKRRFEAKIATVSGADVEFDTDAGALKVPFGAIERAKLVMTDELLKAAASGKMSH